MNSETILLVTGQNSFVLQTVLRLLIRFAFEIYLEDFFPSVAKHLQRWNVIRFVLLMLIAWDIYEFTFSAGVCLWIQGIFCHEMSIKRGELEVLSRRWTYLINYGREKFKQWLSLYTIFKFQRWIYRLKNFFFWRQKRGLDSSHNPSWSEMRKML